MDVDTADFNLDGRTDFVIADNSSKGLILFFQDSGGTFVQQPPLPQSIRAGTVKVGDLNNDGKVDLLSLESPTLYPDTFFVHYQSSLGRFDSVRQFPMYKNTLVEGYVNYAQIGDLNGDGLNDVAIMGGTREQKISIYHQTSDGDLQFYKHLAFPSDCRMFLVEDTDSDNRLDIVAVISLNIPRSAVGIFHQQPDGTFPDTAEYIPESQIPSVFRFADIDQDGYRDLVVLHMYWSILTVHRRKPEGGFEPFLQFESGSPDNFNKAGIAVGDLTGDGYPDVVESEPLGSLSVLKNTSGSQSTIVDWRDIGSPTDMMLQQNFPNPFNPATNIRYSIPTSAFVSLKIYDALGREVKTLIEEVRSAGAHQTVFFPGDLPSGVYIYRLVAGGRVDAKKMILLR
jgi:hypothetical protein